MAERGDGPTQLVPELVQGGAADVGEFDVLEVVPDALVEGIEVWGIARQGLEPEPSGSTTGEEVLDRLATVDGRAVPDDRQVAGIWASRCFKKRTISTLLRAWSCICCSLESGQRSAYHCAITCGSRWLARRMGRWGRQSNRRSKRLTWAPVYSTPKCLAITASLMSMRLLWIARATARRPRRWGPTHVQFMSAADTRARSLIEGQGHSVWQGKASLGMLMKSVCVRSAESGIMSLTDTAAFYPAAIHACAPSARHAATGFSNLVISTERGERNHGNVQSRLRPMRGLKSLPEPVDGFQLWMRYRWSSTTSSGCGRSGHRVLAEIVTCGPATSPRPSLA